MSLNTFLSCPDDCTTPPVLPAIPTNQDCTVYDQPYSQVCDLWLIPSGVSDILDYTDPLVPIVATDTVDNTNADNTKAKNLIGEGSVGTPELIVSEYPKRKTRVTGRTYTLTFRLKNMASTINDLLDKLQCGDTKFTFYYANVGGFIFGGPGGISPASIDVQRPLDGGRDDKMYADVIITWDADGDPKRYSNPYA